MCGRGGGREGREEELGGYRGGRLGRGGEKGGGEDGIEREGSRKRGGRKQGGSSFSARLRLSLHPPVSFTKIGTGDPFFSLATGQCRFPFKPLRTVTGEMRIKE